MSNVIELKTSDFEKKIAKGNWVVDFWAAWCGPCRILSPVVDEVSKELHGKYNFGKVDVDAQSDLAQQYEVMSIPTLIFFKDGEIVNRSVGAMDADALKELIEESF
jgi:thioredoxin 1